MESSVVTCTDEETATLTAAVLAIDALIVEAETALADLQALILQETGSTAAIVTIPFGPVTTAAPRMRVRGFMNQKNL